MSVLVRTTSLAAFGIVATLLLTGLAAASAPSPGPAAVPAPPSGIAPLRAPVPSSGGALFVTVVNYGAAPSGTFDQKVDVDSEAYASLINSNWSNGEAFYASNATPIYLWIESNATNASTHTVLWLRLYSIPGQGQAVVALRFEAKSAFLLSETGYSGENPLLSSSYGEFDNGALVFDFYDNFAGTSLSGQWSTSGTWTYTVNDGFHLTGIPGSGGFISGPSFHFPETVDFYGDLYEDVSASSFVVEGIGTSGCTACGTAASVGFDAGGGGVLTGPTPWVGVGSAGWWGTPVLTSQTYALFTTVAASASEADYYLNYTAHVSEMTTLPTALQPVGLAMSGSPSGTATNTETTYWIRERASAPTAVISVQIFGSQPVTLAALPGTLVVNQSLTLLTSAGTLPFASFSYSGLPTGCTSADLSTLSCLVRQAGQYSPAVTISDGVGDTLTASTNVTVLPSTLSTGPLSAALAAAPATVVQNGGLTLLTVASGGLPPYTYAYGGLPAGCAGADRAAISCTPTALGTFTASVTVSDSLSESATASASVTVTAAPPPPTIPALTVTLTSFGSSLVSGSPLVLVAAVSGGVAPYAFSYSGLPAGCTTANASSLDCVPSGTGQFSIVVTVTDAAQQSATSTSALTLTSSPPPAPTTESSLPNTTLYGLIAGVVVAVLLGLLALVFAFRRSGGASAAK